MKSFIVLLIAAVIINLANGVKYEEEDVYDDDIELKERSYPEEEENFERPSYDINNAADLFKQFVIDYNKTYSTEEEYNKRYAYFVTNLKEIIRLNKQGGSSVSNVNMFADYSADELSNLG